MTVEIVACDLALLCKSCPSAPQLNGKSVHLLLASDHLPDACRPKKVPRPMPTTPTPPKTSPVVRMAEPEAGLSAGAAPLGPAGMVTAGAAVAPPAGAPAAACSAGISTATLAASAPTW